MNEQGICVLTVCSSFLHAFITSACIMSSKQRFVRNMMHVPYGYIGGVIAKHNINYGFIYFTLVIMYQILQEIGNLIMYKHDLSWYDIEGYTIGFSYHVFFSFLKTRRDDEVVI